jgi:hypothetical protein
MPHSVPQFCLAECGRSVVSSIEERRRRGEEALKKI